MPNTPPSRPAPTTAATPLSKPVVLACIMLLVGVGLVVASVAVLAGWPWAMLTAGAAVGCYGWILLTDETRTR